MEGRYTMSQTRRQSLLESIMNVVVGFTINLILNFTFFPPLFGWHISLKQNIALGVIYTAISILRSYTLRRFYNRLHGQPQVVPADDVHWEWVREPFNRRLLPTSPRSEQFIYSLEKGSLECR